MADDPFNALMRQVTPSPTATGTTEPAPAQPPTGAAQPNVPSA
jgi:hypothetical protein